MDWLKPLIENLGRLVVAFFSFVAGRKAVELEQTREALNDIKKANDIASAVNAASPDDIERLRDEWTRK